MENKNYLSTGSAIFLSILLLGLSLGGQFYLSMQKDIAEKKYVKLYNNIKEKREEEVNNEIKGIFEKIGKNTDLVYGLSLFHTNPVDILKQVEQAIYIGRYPNGDYKIVTNENLTFNNYNEISIGLGTNDLENFATLIKKLKKMYNGIFEYKGLQNFGIKEIKDKNGEKTGKVFYTTSLKLKYLKDDYLNNLKNEENLDNQVDLAEVYQNNELAFESLDKLLNELKEKRKDKKEKYFNSKTKDNSIFLGTDIEYKNWDIFYINGSNDITGLFELNGIGSKDDYNILKNPKNSLILFTKQDGSDYAICTKIEKKELNELEKKEKELKNKIFTEIKVKGKLDKTLQTFCNLL